MSSLRSAAEAGSGSSAGEAARWDARAKGKKSRQVPITAKLAASIKRYEARHRDHARVPNMLVNDRGLPYTLWGIDQLMDRIEGRGPG